MRFPLSRRARATTRIVLAALMLVVVGSAVSSFGGAVVEPAGSLESRLGGTTESARVDHSPTAVARSGAARSLAARLPLVFEAVVNGLALLIIVVGIARCGATGASRWEGSAGNRTRGPPVWLNT